MNTHRSDLQSSQALPLLARMLDYDPAQRITASDALSHQYFKESPPPVMKSVSSHPSDCLFEFDLLFYISSFKYNAHSISYPIRGSQKKK